MTWLPGSSVSSTYGPVPTACDSRYSCPWSVSPVECSSKTLGLTSPVPYCAASTTSKWGYGYARSNRIGVQRGAVAERHPRMQMEGPARRVVVGLPAIREQWLHLAGAVALETDQALVDAAPDQGLAQ